MWCKGRVWYGEGMGGPTRQNGEGRKGAGRQEEVEEYASGTPTVMSGFARPLSPARLCRAFYRHGNAKAGE